MSYNDGWRVYGDIPVNIEKLNILSMNKATFQKQLTKQIEKVDKVSQEVRKTLEGNVSKARRSKANMRLQGECEARDNLERRIRIIEEWMDLIRVEIHEN